tara:strand:- start:1294 stop:1917 length:624 start_codon:yes stop_codon:yes gene_type:complete
MKLDVVRTQFGSDATNSLLFIDSVFECYGLEDEIRDQKKHSETAIPLGEYEIKFRTVGGFHTRTKSRYDAKYGEGWHLGMLELQDVPNFKYILIHTGNTDENTAGCYLVGNTQQDLDVSKDGFIGSSRNAYEKMYPKVRDALVAGEKVTIRYSDINLNEIIDDVAKGLSNKATEDVVLTRVIDDKFDKILKELKNLRSAVFTVKNIT